MKIVTWIVWCVFSLSTTQVFAETGWKINGFIGHKIIPGKYFYKEEVTTLNNGTITDDHFEQAEVGSDLQLTTVRVEFTREVTPSLAWGLEMGLDSSLIKTSHKWLRPPTGSGSFTGTTRTPIWDSTPPLLPSGGGEITFRKEVTTIAFPLLLKARSEILAKDRFSFSVGAAFGEYIVTQQIDGSRRKGPSDDSDTIAVQDKFVAVKPMLELKPEFAFRLKSGFTLRVTTELGYISKFGQLALTGTTSSSFRNEYELGGLTYGGGLAFNLNF
ncbi:MAG: hypothetical protein HY399_03580 [Elusimicrobia bacterium]|nr:hypothetical protein [Elusimicrobiota bacterium]